LSIQLDDLVNLSPLPIQKFFSNNGRPLDGGLLFTYAAGTSVKIATYTDSSGLSSNTNPIVLDFRGECRLWIDPLLAYKFILSPANDTDPPTDPIWTVDNITAAPAQLDNAAIDTGSVNNIVLSIPQISSPVAFTRIVFKAANTNTGPVTITINGGTSKALTWQSTVALTGGEIFANGIYEAIYDGARWQLQGPTLLPGDVRLYGAVGDGVTDCTTALRAAAAALTNGGTLFFEPNGVYMFNPVAGSLGVKFTNVSGFKIQGNGATIKAIDAAPVDGDNQILYFIGCSDALIENLTVDGNRANRTITVDVAAANIQITTGCARLKFNRVRAINSVEDGWYINTATEGVAASYPTDVTLEDCEGFNSWRNNVSLVGSLRFTIRGGRYHGANGTDPEAGIDLEPNSTTTFGNIDARIEAVDVSNNTRYGVTIGLSSGAGPLNERTIIRDLRGQENGLAFLRVAGAAKGVDIDGVWCGPHSAAITRGLVDFGADATITDVVARNLHFNDITCAFAASRALIYVHGTITERLRIEGVYARNSTLPLLVGEAVYNLSAVDGRNFDIGILNAVINTATAERCLLRDIRIEDSEGYGAIFANPDIEIDGMTLIDCASTVASAYYVGTRPIARNISVYQTTSIPAGQKALRFDAAPAVVDGVRAFSAGTTYDASNTISLTGGVTGSFIANCHPPALVQTVASAATVTLPRVGTTFLISGTTNITSIVASNWDGQEVTLVFQGALTFTDGSNLKLAGNANFVTTADDTITLVCDGTNWYEVARSVN
jgi:hypothetical protein